jgi:glycerol-3-phosphate acyltransferase PlsY
MSDTPAVGFGLLLAAAYLAGSIPFGRILFRWRARGDIRERGSGNIGATNVARVAGAGLGLATLAGDMLKGLMPAIAAGRLAPGGALDSEASAALAALAAVVGHIAPVYTRFGGGGKGVATAGGGFAAAAPAAALAAAGVFLAVAFAGRRVSAGSLAAAACLPLFVAAFGGGMAASGAAAAAAALIFLRHRDNIRRLLRGDEPPFDLRRPPRRR